MAGQTSAAGAPDYFDLTPLMSPRRSGVFQMVEAFFLTGGVGAGNMYLFVKVHAFFPRSGALVSN